MDVGEQNQCRRVSKGFVYGKEFVSYIGPILVEVVLIKIVHEADFKTKNSFGFKK